MSSWIDHLALWRFTLFYFSAMLLAVVVGGIGLEDLMGRVDVAWLVGYGAVFSAVQTIWAAWARRRRQYRLSSQERLSVPGKMRPYVGLSSAAQNVDGETRK
jgi:hypothetical protein